MIVFTQLHSGCTPDLGVLEQASKRASKRASAVYPYPVLFLAEAGQPLHCLEVGGVL